MRKFLRKLTDTVFDKAIAIIFGCMIVLFIALFIAAVYLEAAYP